MSYTKFCKHCTTTKLVSEFSFDAGKRLKGRCKSCESARMREYRAANLEQVRAADRAAYAAKADKIRLTNMCRNYKISNAQAQAVVAHRRCDICRRDCKVVVDHCHVAGAPRGVLCSSCNAGLGQFRDQPDVLRRAAEYIEQGGFGFFQEVQDEDARKHAQSRSAPRR